MSLLSELAAALDGGRVRIIDLTAPLQASTPVLQLPEQFGQTATFQLEQISRFDDAGPAWYWNNFHTGEHTGTHFDAPNHWITGRDEPDVASVPLQRLIRPAAVIDVTERVAENPDFLLEVSDIEAWQQQHGPLPEGGWLIYRTGWSSRNHDQTEFLNADDDGPHTPGMSVECARWLAEQAPIIGIGVETVGTDAGAAGGFDPAFPCHSFLLGAGKYGLAQLQNVDQLPPTGALIISSPLPIVTGSGSPARVLALVED